MDFPRSVQVSLATSAIFTAIIMMIDFAGWKQFLQSWNLYVVVATFAIINNSYQVLTHVLTFLKFLGLPLPMIPGGAKDDQTVLNFTFHNQLDLWGWWAHFLITGHANFAYAALAATHMAVGLVALAAPELFQRYYISNKDDTPAYHYIKTNFVFTDALCRSYALYSLI